ncbi:MAG: ABC transporter permease [Betaproteobacteria bacterium]|nr:ABC transporter permease [Betaproteobacteria bacterium]
MSWKDSRWTGIGVLVLLAVLWEAAGRWGWVHKVLFPPASAILATLLDVIASGEILQHLGVSLWRAALGYALAAMSAIALGVAMGYWRRIYDACEITIEYARAVPPPAVIPVAMVFLGFGDALKVFIIFFACLFPILVNTIDGVRSVEPVLIRTARTFGLSPLRIVRQVILPVAGPYIMTGLRIATAIALILTVISEMIGATSGIGYFILGSQRTLNITQMYAGILVLALTGYAINRVFLLVDERIMAWHKGLTRHMQ